MKNIKLITAKIFFLSAILLTNGCANDAEQIEKLSSDINNLNIKSDQINKDLETIKKDVQLVQEEAIRANQRLDNQVNHYKK